MICPNCCGYYRSGETCGICSNRMGVHRPAVQQTHRFDSRAPIYVGGAEPSLDSNLSSEERYIEAQMEEVRQKTRYVRENYGF